MEQDYRPSKDLRDATVIKSSTTTSAGVGGGTTLVDSGLTQADDYWNNMAVLILSGNSNGQIRRISDFANATGTITVDTAFASQIASGTKYMIIALVEAAAGGGDATAANQVLILGDIGDASASALGSLYAILGNPAQTFNTMVGYEGAVSLASKLTAARALLLDNLDVAISSRSTLTQANILSDATPFAGAGIATINTNTTTTVVGRRQVVEVSVTSAANAGAVTIGTVNTQSCVIESIIIHADTAQTSDLTSCPVTGGAGNVVTFITAAIASQANLNAADKQVAWTGAVRLAATKTIVMTLNGTGATAVDLTVIITYYSASANGGTIT